MNYFEIGGRSSDNFGVYIGGQETFNAPVRDVEKVSIPGRNGDLIIDHGRWNNIVIAYNAVIMEDFAANVDDFCSWLHSLRGYNKLTDTYHTDWFRLAAFHDDIEFITSAFNATGKAQIRFDCKPQKFLYTGDEAVQIAVAGGTIENPTRYESRPLIDVSCWGQGTLTVNDTVITIDHDSSGDITIDSELYDCYDEDRENCNSAISLNKFPVLKPGTNTISCTGDVDDIWVTGRWFKI